MKFLRGFIVGVVVSFLLISKTSDITLKDMYNDIRTSEFTQNSVRWVKDKIELLTEDSKKAPNTNEQETPNDEDELGDESQEEEEVTEETETEDTSEFKTD